MRKVPPEKLKKILADHKLWLETNGKKGAPADLTEANFRGADLQGANLQKANLQRADLQEANLEGTNLQGADLRRALLVDANLQRADLRRALLVDANLQRADLRKADLRGAKLQGADLQRANLIDANLQKANLNGADLRNASFERICLKESNLQEAILRLVNLQNASLDNAILRDADLQDADLTETKGLQAGQLGGANVSGTKLPGDIAKFDGLDHVEEISRNARKIFLWMLLACVYSGLTIATTTDARLLTNSASSPLPIIQTEIPIAWFYRAAPFILLSLYFYLHFYLQRLWAELADLPAVFTDGKPLDKKAYPWLLSGLVRAHFRRLRGDRPPLSGLENFISILLAWWVVPFTLLLFWGRYLPRHEWGGTALHIALLVASIATALLLHGLAVATLRGQIWKNPLAWNSDHKKISHYRALRCYGYLAVILCILGFASSSFIDGWPSPLHIVPADLRKADLQRVDFEGRNLKRADLRYADLEGANLLKADLQRANLRLANLQGADLFDANLQGADLRAANLQRANLRLANLQGADLRGATLQEAKLRGADLRGANLSDADLRDANLSDADLTDTTGLTQEQLDQACGNEFTKLPPDFVVKPCPE